MDYCDFQSKYNFIYQHKAKPVAFSKIEEGRNLRAEIQANERKSRRLDDFNSNRTLSSPNTNQRLAAKSDKELKIEQRLLQLKRWKEEKLKKQQGLKKKLKPFTVGIVRHGLAPFEAPSPVKKTKNSSLLPKILITRSNAKVTQKAPSDNSVSKSTGDKTSKNVGKSTLKEKSFAPPDAKFNPPKNVIKSTYAFGANSGPLTRSKFAFPGQPKVLANVKEPHNKIQKLSQKPVLQKLSKTKFENSKKNVENKKVEPKPKLVPKAKENISPVLQNPSLEIQAISMLHRKTSTPENKSKPQDGQPIDVSDKTGEFSYQVYTPESKSSNSSGSNNNVTVVSPFVTVARGKGSLNREKFSKLKYGFTSDNSEDEDAVIRFRLLLEGEIERLSSLCKLWSTYQVDNDATLPEHAKELIFQAVGQTNLLITKKFEQFRGLIDRCESHQCVDGGGSVTSQDLQGFWDMIFMQVEDIDSRFKRLTNSKAEHWPDKNEEMLKAKTKTTKAKKKNTFKKTYASTLLKDYIQASRMKNNKSEDKHKLKSKSETSVLVDQTGVKTFEAGFFSVVSPMKDANQQPTAKNRNKIASPYLKEVLTSETRKRLSIHKSTPSSLAMMRVSLTAKCTLNSMDNELKPVGLASPLVPINLNATPGKSILKSQSRRPVRRQYACKTGKTVLFTDSNEDLDITKTLDSNNLDVNTTYDLLNLETVKDSLNKIESEQNTEVPDAKNTQSKRHNMTENKENTSAVKTRVTRKNRRSFNDDIGINKDDQKENTSQITGDTFKTESKSVMITQEQEESLEKSVKSEDLPSISILSLNTVTGKPRNTRKHLAVADETLSIGTPNTPVRRSARLSLKN